MATLQSEVKEACLQEPKASPVTFDAALYMSQGFNLSFFVLLFATFRVNNPMQH